jgi:hypothetical protein
VTGTLRLVLGDQLDREISVPRELNPRCDGAPEGGHWNLDADHRKPLPHGLAPPCRTLDRRSPERVAVIRGDSDRFLNGLTGAPANAAA